jgi:16S rRNA (guanine527-N7)-methyltransferase
MSASSENRGELVAGLAAGIGVLGLDLSEAQQQNLMAYLDLIQKWNKVYNLTALRDPKEMLTHHLLDSLSAVGPLQRHLQAVLSFDEQGCALLDVGSGGGLPGVVVAICCPKVRVTCVDAVSKKAAFVQQVAASLKLPNLKGVHARVESLSGPFDVVCSRAFASLPDFVAWSSGALADAGVWMAMKGKLPTDEMLALPSFAQVFHVEQLQVPGLDAERCMIWMKKSSSSSS